MTDPQVFITVLTTVVVLVLGIAISIEAVKFRKKNETRRHKDR